MLTHVVCWRPHPSSTWQYIYLALKANLPFWISGWNNRILEIRCGTGISAPHNKWDFFHLNWKFWIGFRDSRICPHPYRALFVSQTFSYFINIMLYKLLENILLKLILANGIKSAIRANKIHISIIIGRCLIPWVDKIWKVVFGSR